MERYEVMPSRVWQHRTTGQRVSIYGACPWRGGAEREQWELITLGWTVADNKLGTVGIGRVPWKTEAEAQAWVDARKVTA